MSTTEIGIRAREQLRDPIGGGEVYRHAIAFSYLAEARDRVIEVAAVAPANKCFCAVACQQHGDGPAYPGCTASDDCAATAQ
jgi:hypothetical protein